MNYSKKEENSFEILKDEFLLKDTGEMLKKWDLTGDTYKFNNYTVYDDLLKYPNPNIPVVLVTTRSLNTK